MLHPQFTSTLVDIPRPMIDPVTTFPEALGIVALAAARPRRAGSILLVLDRRRRGLGLHRIAEREIHLPHSVAAMCSRTARAHGAFLVTFRQGSPVMAHDPEVFQRFRNILRSTGHHLIDWVVAGPGGFWCPRVLVEDTDPWDRTSD